MCADLSAMLKEPVRPLQRRHTSPDITGGCRESCSASSAALLTPCSKRATAVITCDVPCTVMQVGVITRAAGSAYTEIGQTKLMVAVYGPRPSVRPAAARVSQCSVTVLRSLRSHHCRSQDLSVPRRGDSMLLSSAKCLSCAFVQDRKVGFTETGRLQVDIKLASFATHTRGRVQQVMPCQKSWPILYVIETWACRSPTRSAQAQLL